MQSMNIESITPGKTTAIIPAKMTSQRLPGKNLADLCGKPLIYYSIEVVKCVPSINDVYVSSEDEKVLELASSFGANIIKRPDELSEPHITTKDVLSHSYKQIGNKTGEYPELVVLLQPTHPLRKPEQIERAITIMKNKTKFDCLFSVMATDDLRGQIKKNIFVPEFPLPRIKSKEPKLYKNTGSFYIFRPHRSFLTNAFFGNKIYPFVQEGTPFEIDIDYPYDMDLCRCLLCIYQDQFPFFKILPPGE